MLDHWQVSRRHAYLQLIEGRYYCVDLGSRTGTHGGDATERSGWLERGRAIQIGPFTVRPEWPDRAARRPRPLPGRDLGAAGPGDRPGGLADGPAPGPGRPVAGLQDPDRRARRLEVPLQPGPDPDGRLGRRPPRPEGRLRQRRAGPLRPARGRRRAPGRPARAPAPVRHARPALPRPRRPPAPSRPSSTIVPRPRRDPARPAAVARGRAAGPARPWPSPAPGARRPPSSSRRRRSSTRRCDRWSTSSA